MAIIEPRIFDELKKALTSFGDKYFIGDELNRAKVADDLRAYDEALLTKLFQIDFIKDNYVKQVAGQKLFQIDQLEEAVLYDDYWDTSYTKYENRIGLVSGGRYIEDSQDVILAYPFKDGVLTASMTKDDNDESYDDAFLNEVIEKDEIDRLLEGKIFNNLKKFDGNGSSEDFRFDFAKDNLVIKGNNLLALSSISEKFLGSVKLVYIDVPYYFKKKISGDAFKYNSNFHLSAWLVFLKNRLEIARKLVSEDGSIWIHISEDGMHYLKVMADSVFGKNNFVGTIPRKTRNGKSDVPYNFSQDFDWMLVYTQSPESAAIMGRGVDRKYYETDDFPGRPWRKADLTKQTTIEQRPNSNFTMINPKTGVEYPVNPKRSWAVSKDTFMDWYKNGGIGFPDDYEFMNGNKPFRRVFKDQDEANEKESSVSSDFLLKQFSGVISGDAVNKKGNEEIDELFNRDEFDYAKPEILMRDILNVTTNEGDLVLDFFMGSGTTQAVAMKMHRRFIGIEQMDYINTVSVPRLQKVIAGEQGGISKDVDWQGGGSFVYAELFPKNMGYLQDVIAAKTMSELQSVYDRMQTGIEGSMAPADISFRADLSKIEWDPSKVKFDDQKRLLVKLLDKNGLYYNYSEIDDADVREFLSDEDYQFNKSFYGDGE